MNIRQAEERDIAAIGLLLEQVNAVHHEGRPDLFRRGRKYTDNELLGIIADAHSRPILVAEDGGRVLGYAFCIFMQQADGGMMVPVKTLYIDDLCVDAAHRGQHVGSQLYAGVVDMARRAGCHNVTLNVWSCNPQAIGFYQRLGLVPQKIGMEKILSAEK